MSNINVNNITPLAGESGTVSVSGSLLVKGTVTANGNIILGDANTDSISLGAEISSSIIPDADSTYNLGSSAKQWFTLFVDHISSLKRNRIEKKIIKLKKEGALASRKNTPSYKSAI